MQRLFCMFPAGWPGVGLLLLRATVGITTVVQGGVYVADWASPTFGTWAVGLLAVATGASVVIGFLTPIAGALVGLGSAAIELAWFPAAMPNLLGAKLATFFVLIMSVAIVFLGPGAFSLDSYLFARREIVIPPTSHLRKP